LSNPLKIVLRVIEFARKSYIYVQAISTFLFFILFTGVVLAVFFSSLPYKKEIIFSIAICFIIIMWIHQFVKKKIISAINLLESCSGRINLIGEATVELLPINNRMLELELQVDRLMKREISITDNVIEKYQSSLEFKIRELYELKANVCGRCEYGIDSRKCKKCFIRTG